MEATYIETQQISFQDFKNQILEDYKLGRISREMSYLGRREVLTGKAKFGIFGDGKELPQLAMAKVFKNGDFRSGYYRDQTFAMAINAVSVESFFAQLYAGSAGPGLSVFSLCLHRGSGRASWFLRRVLYPLSADDAQGCPQQLRAGFSPFSLMV